MFDNLKTDDTIAVESDRLGGSFLLDSNVYDMGIDLAYFDVSKGGATSLTFHFKGKNGENLRQTFWVTSGKAKGATNYYLDKDGNKQYLPGFSQANSICKLASGKDMGDLTTEAKTIKIWNGELKKEAPTERQVATELLGKEITLGVLRQIVNKSVKGDDNKYHDTNDSREENEVEKAFRATDHLTNAEIAAGETEAVFYDKWKEKNVGNTRNKFKEVAGEAGSGSTSGGQAKSLFA